MMDELTELCRTDERDDLLAQAPEEYLQLA